MKKYVYVLLVLVPLSLSSQIFSERGSEPKIVEPYQVRFNLISPGIDFEIGLFKNQTVYGGTGLGLAYYDEGYAFGLAVNAEYRLYHNLNRRIRMDKFIAGNSGNYIGFARSIFFNQLIILTDIPSDDFNVGYYGLIYGIQRTYERGLSFDVSTGVGYYLGDGIPSGVGPILKLRIGWVATKRKQKTAYFKTD